MLFIHTKEVEISTQLAHVISHPGVHNREVAKIRYPTPHTPSTHTPTTRIPPPTLAGNNRDKKSQAT